MFIQTLATENFDLFWHPYIRLEKSFLKTMNFVELDKKNFKAFSNAYQDIIIRSGSEIDISMRYYCKQLDTAYKMSNQTMENYKTTIMQKNREFASAKVKTLVNDILLDNWASWRNKKEEVSWWKVYNKIKHDRTGKGKINSKVEKPFFEYANQEYALRLLGVYYQTLIYMYRFLAEKENKKPILPMPGSRLFTLVGDYWNDITFPTDNLFYFDDGCLYCSSSKLPYEAI